MRLTPRKRRLALHVEMQAGLSESGEGLIVFAFRHGPGKRHVFRVAMLEPLALDMAKNVPVILAAAKVRQ